MKPILRTNPEHLPAGGMKPNGGYADRGSCPSAPLRTGFDLALENPVH